MLGVSCPLCKETLTFSQRKELLYNHAIRCAYCARPVKIKERDGTINAIAIGAFGGVLLAKFTALEIWQIAIVIGVAIFPLHRLVDVFFALEEASEEELL